VLVCARGHTAWWLRCCLAVWFAALLAIAPFARPSLPVHLALVAPASSVQSLAAHDNSIAQAREPATRLRPAQPSTLGILSRLSSLNPPPGTPLIKTSLLGPGAPEEAVAAARRSTGFGGDLRQTFHRSSVGTARTPTGPPA
jgi:hypothetical protein